MTGVWKVQGEVDIIYTKWSAVVTEEIHYRYKRRNINFSNIWKYIKLQL
jgi:hypothetical protein